MTSQSEMDAQFAQSELERRVQDLETKISQYEQGGFDLFRQFGYLQLGLNLPRLDNKGIQIQAEQAGSAGIPAIYFNKKFVPDPAPLSSNPVRLSLSGSIYDLAGNDVTTMVMAALDNTQSLYSQMTVSNIAGFAEVYGAALAGGGTQAGFNLVKDETKTSGYFQLYNAVLRLAWTSGFTADPNDLQNGDIWYNSSTNKINARINGATVELGGGGSMPMPPIVGTVSWNCLGAELAAMKSTVTTAAASTAWPAANRAIYIPVKVTEDCTVTKLWVYNGATASGNVNMCLYNSSFAQVANTEIGSTAQSGTNVVQEFDITNTALTAGLYYIACVFSSGTGTAWAFATSGDTPVELLQSWGMAQEAIGSVDLPATATPAAVASAFIPFVGMSISPRTLVT